MEDLGLILSLSSSSSSSISSSSSSSSSSISSPSQHAYRRQNTVIDNFASFSSESMRADIWSLVVVLLTFWFFASMILILCIYGSADLILSPNCSRLLQANSFFVQDIKLSRTGESGHGLVTLYGFRKPPLLDIRTMWSETYNISTPSNFSKEWIYYLNGQAQINISFAVKSNGSEPLILVIAQGRESLNQWIENPSYPNTTLSWNLIHGNGKVQQNITKPSDYYVAVGNLNQQEMEVQLDFRIQTFLYNLTGASYKCTLGHSSCALKLLFMRANVAILTTPGPKQDAKNDYVKLSYGPRWIIYFAGSGGLTIVILLAFKICIHLLLCSGNGAGQHNADFTIQTSRLLPNKDCDDLSLGSSYDSVSQDDDEDIDEWLNVSSKMLNECKADNSYALCSICCDAQRDCFFLPCGHCATCFTCGRRKADEAGTCPICRRRMKKVKQSPCNLHVPVVLLTCMDRSRTINLDPKDFAVFMKCVFD